MKGVLVLSLRAYRSSSSRSGQILFLTDVHLAQTRGDRTGFVGNDLWSRPESFERCSMPSHTHDVFRICSSKLRCTAAQRPSGRSDTLLQIISNQDFGSAKETRMPVVARTSCDGNTCQIRDAAGNSLDLSLSLNLGFLHFYDESGELLESICIQETTHGKNCGSFQFKKMYST